MFSWNSTKRCFGNFLRLHKETFRGFCEIFKSSIKEVDSFEVWDERSIILVFLNLKFSAIGLEFIFAKHLMSLGFSEQLPLSWHFSLLFCTKCCLILGQFSIFTFSGTYRKKCQPQCFVAVPTSFCRLNAYSENLIAKFLSARFLFVNSVHKLCKLILIKILTYQLTFNMTP